MILTVKHKFSIYRRFEKDIWGICYTDISSRRLKNKDIQCKSDLFKLNYYWKFFFKLYQARYKHWEWKNKRYVYDFEIVPYYRKRKEWNMRFITIRLTRLYFLTIQDHQFRKLFRKATKMDGNMEQNYCYLLEGRIISVLYRSQFLCNPFEIISFVKRGNALVEFKVINYINSLVPLGKIVTIKKKYRRKYLYEYRLRIMKRALMHWNNKFLFTSYKFFFVYLVKYPRKIDLVYPISLDIQRITGYY